MRRTCIKDAMSCSSRYSNTFLASAHGVSHKNVLYLLNTIELRKTPTKFFSLWGPDLEEKNKLPKYKNRIKLELKELRRSGPSSFDCAKNLAIYFLEKAMKYFNTQFYKL